MTEGGSCRVELSRQTLRSFERLGPQDRARVARALDGLERDPRPRGKLVKALSGTHDSFLRYRIGDLRLMYEVHEPEGLVLVVGLVHRGDLEDWVRRHRG